MGRPGEAGQLDGPARRRGRREGEPPRNSRRGIAQEHIDPPPRDVELVCFGAVGRERLWRVWDSLFPPVVGRKPERRRRAGRRFVKELPEE